MNRLNAAIFSVAVASLVLLSALASVVSADGGGDGTDIAGWSDPKACIEVTSTGICITDGSPGAATPGVPTPTTGPARPEPTPTPSFSITLPDDVDTIVALPSTGVGTTAHNDRAERADGWQGYAAYSRGCNAYGREWYRMVWWHHYWHFAYGDYIYYTGKYC